MRAPWRATARQPIDKLAFGWPKGIFEFVDDFGAAAVVDTLKSKQAKAPEWLRDLYKPDPLLVNWNP